MICLGHLDIFFINYLLGIFLVLLDSPKYLLQISS